MFKKMLIAAGFAGCLLCVTTAFAGGTQTAPKAAKPRVIRIECDLDFKNPSYDVTQEAALAAAKEVNAEDPGASLVRRGIKMAKVVCDSTRRPIVRLLALDKLYETTAMQTVLNKRLVNPEPWGNDLTGSAGAVQLVSMQTTGAKTCSVLSYGSLVPVLSTSFMFSARMRFCYDKKNSDWLSDKIISAGIVPIQQQQPAIGNAA